MAKNLVIVESPAKAKTISKFLGKEFEIVSCMGHIIDLPQKKLGIDVENNYKADYVVIPKKKKLLTELRKKSKGKEKVYFATDPDREGEAIGWNLKEKLKVEEEQSLRVEFHEITERAIKESFVNPREFNKNRIQAQQARRILDRIVGYFLSPLLWKKISRGLSAGRVQSVALKLIVEREREIQKFIPEEFWKVTVELNKKEQNTEQDKINFTARLDKNNNKKLEIKTQEEADALTEGLKKSDFLVNDISLQKKNKSSPAPFITSSLQQDSFNKLGFSATKTMFVAQQLYEGVELGQEGAVGLITYMRTDSTQMAQVAIKELRDYISKEIGKEYLPEKPHVYKSRKMAQEAHEAIRPTDFYREPQKIQNFLSPDQFKLYELIWKRAVASQMKYALYEVMSVEIKAGDFILKASGSKVIFDGFGKLYGIEDAEEEKEKLPPLSKGDLLNLVNVLPSQHFTKPPGRYSEGSLVKALEEDGVGRPSTYAPVINTITSRDYVRREKGYLHPTELGFKVNDLLVEYFPKIIDIEFTARMEEELDKVEEGNYNWINILNEFYQPFKESLEHAKNTIVKEVIYSEEKCETCGKQMVVKWGRKGRFLSCSDYPRCKFSKSITSGKKCPEPDCGGDLIERRSGKGRTFFGCSNFPKCRFTSSKLPE